VASFDAWRHRVGLLPYDEAVAIKWGEIQGNAHLRGRPRPVNDSWIAACCLAHDIPLATFNVKDYADYAEHDGLRLVSSDPSSPL
jgi:predicted nucleic acid-binding protein